MNPALVTLEKFTFDPAVIRTESVTAPESVRFKFTFDPEAAAAKS